MTTWEEEQNELVPVQASHPPSFYCPISHQCMHDPVVLSDGHTYERRHIERWLQGHSTSPVSGLLLQQKDIFPNHALRNAIEEYFQQVFSAHRRAIRKTMNVRGPGEEDVSSVSLVHAIDALMQCSMLMNADLTLESVLGQIMEEAKTLLGAEAASVFLLDGELQELYSTVNSLGREIRIPVTVGIAGWVARTGEPLLIQDAYNDDRFDRTVDVKTGFRTRSIMCVPLKDRRSGVMGVVQLINKGGSRSPTSKDSRTRSKGGDGAEVSFSVDDQQFLHVFASQAASAIASSGAFTSQSQEGASYSRATSSSELDVLAQDQPSPKAKLQSCARAERILDQAFCSWDFDAFELAGATGNKPLSTLGRHLFERLGLVEHFDLDEEKLGCFFEEIERGYDDANPYHNRAHAASVLHAMHCLLEHGGLAKAVAPLSKSSHGKGSSAGAAPLERMACLVAAAVHDYEHEGLTNDFMVKTRHERAIRYNDQNVNEQHHVAAAFKVLMRPECNFLQGLPVEDFRQVRKLMIDLVLGTDMARHGSILTSAQDLACPASEQEVTLLLQLAMKCSDLGHLALEWDLHTRWVRCLEEEFFRQGDREKQAGLPFSFMTNRDQPGITSSQTGFFENVVLPLFKELARVAPAAAPMLAAVEENLGYWQVLEAAKSSTGLSDPDAASEAVRRSSKRRTSRRLCWQPQPELDSAAQECQEESAAASSSGPAASEPTRKRRSGRARQRAAKFWASVRQRTPSLSPGPF